jgi:hypothetical protein
MTSARVAFLLVALSTALSSAQEAGSKPARASKKVLVELYTSQGCNSCPSANVFLAEMAKLGYGPDQVVPLSFHVDYFNTPWVDPFSNKDFSRREMAYNSVLKRNDLYFTPMMMVDGRYPMLGSNRPEAFKALKKALAEKPGATIQLAVSGSESEPVAKVTVTTRAGEIGGRPLMIGLALTEGPITTKVPSGENAGAALVEPFIVRSFAFEKATLENSTSRSFSFPIKLPADAVASRCRVATFVQDWDNGQVYQAESIPLAFPATARR